MADISQTTFSNAFSLIKIYDFSINTSLKFVSKVPINNIPSLVQIMTWRRPGTKTLSEPMIVSLLANVSLVQIMAWCQPGTKTLSELMMVSSLMHISSITFNQLSQHGGCWWLGTYLQGPLKPCWWHVTSPISGILTSSPSHTTMPFEVMDGAKATALIFAE